jgi:hypothetical protein
LAPGAPGDDPGGLKQRVCWPLWLARIGFDIDACCGLFFKGFSRLCLMELKVALQIPTQMWLSTQGLGLPAVSPLHPLNESRKTRTEPWEMNSSRIAVLVHARLEYDGQ